MSLRRSIPLLFLTFAGLVAFLSACQPAATPVSAPPASASAPAAQAPLPSASPTSRPDVPDFAHIVVFFFENEEFDSVIGNPSMPYTNQLAGENTLLTQFYAETHPSLPNYIAAFGGELFGISSDCTGCFINAASLPDQIEASGRTWRAYLEDLPGPCFVGDHGAYAQKHNPFIYFDPIRLEPARCKASIVPLTQLDTDLAAGKLPNFIYIMPNLCNSAHDASINPYCSLATADGWLKAQVHKLQAYLQPRAEAEPYLIVVTWDEGQTDKSCCGLPSHAGGRIATLLVSPLAKHGFQDATPYTHYSLLRTIESAWGLALLGHAADAGNVVIQAPWK